MGFVVVEPVGVACPEPGEEVEDEVGCEETDDDWWEQRER